MTGKRLPNSPSGSPFSGSKLDQDQYLPIANVSRIMKKSLPANAKISKEAKETVQECVSEFISFITGEASDKCQREKRKTVNGDDLLWAMTTLGFENYVGPLKDYLNKYRENEGGENINITSTCTDHNINIGHEKNTGYIAFGGNLEVINNNSESRQGIIISTEAAGFEFDASGINRHEW